LALCTPVILSHSLINLCSIIWMTCLYLLDIQHSVPALSQNRCVLWHIDILSRHNCGVYIWMVQNYTLDKYKKPTHPLYNGSLVYFMMLFRPGFFLYKVQVPTFYRQLHCVVPICFRLFCFKALYNSPYCLSATTEHISLSNRVSVYQ
jgi:hypothetical protein